MDTKQVLATVVLAAGMPGKLETAQRMMDLIRGDDASGHYAIEPVDDGKPVPTTDEDWEFHIVKNFFFQDTVYMKPTRKVKAGPIPQKENDE